MTADWILYCLALGALLAAAAVALEGGARALRLPTRWGWGGAMALLLVLPAAAWLRPTPVTITAAPAEGTPIDVLSLARLPIVETAEAAATALPWLAAAERWFAAGWGVASAAVLLWIGAMTLVLAWRRRRWTADAAAGVPVLYAPDTGPAVVGLLRGRIVLPAWAREAEPRVLETMVSHEREHLRAGDHRLLGLGLLVLAAMPWHPAVWWMLRRLRLAVEVDCDARVLRRRADVHAYGCILLEVGQRAGRLPLGAAALSQPVSFLERRIRIMTSPRVRFPRLRAGALALAASGLVLAACEMSSPSGPTPVDARRVHGDADAPAGIQPAEMGPREAVLHHFPNLAREAGSAGATLAFVIGADGSILRAARIGDAPESVGGAFGAGSRPATLNDLNVEPDDIQSIEVIRFPEGTAAPVRVGVVWMRLKPAGAARGEGGRASVLPARISPTTVEGADEAIAVRPLTPAEAGAAGSGAPMEIVVVPATGAAATEGAVRVRLRGDQATVEGAAGGQDVQPSRIRIRSADESVPNDVLVIITDAAGNEVHRGAMPSREALDPDRIATIEVLKGPAAATPNGEIRIRLKD